MESSGIVIEKDKITIEPKITTPIENYGVPKTFEQLRSFIKLVACYKKFIGNFAKILGPLTFHSAIPNHDKNHETNLNPVALFAFNRLKSIFFGTN